MTTLLDVTWPVTPDMTVYRRNPRPRLRPLRWIPRDSANLSILTIGLHTGTHVDAPRHFLRRGGDIVSVDPARLAGPCVVVDCTAARDRVGAEDLRRARIPRGVIVLLKTRNSDRPADAPFDPGFVFLDRSGADYLRRQRARAVGTDYLGIERDQPGHPTHRTLLGAGIPVVEGLRLRRVRPGRYLFLALPLPIAGAEASPVRAVLVRGARWSV
jgi:arylformamidase